MSALHRPKEHLLAIVAGCMLAAAPACIESKEIPVEDSEINLPLFSQPEDFENIQLASLDPCGAPVSAVMSFNAPNQAFGVSIQVPADTTIDAHTSGAAFLDTILAIYGPADDNGFYGEVPLAVDDDSGAGDFAAFLDLTLDEAGAYFVVVTTASGQGSGDAVLTIGADCEPLPGDCAVDGAACDDGDACTTDETCVAGACVGVVVDCDDGVPCTQDQCEPTGACSNVLIDGCDEPEPCADVDCDDGNPCTTEVCDADTYECVYLPLDGAACDDGDACTANDACAAGVCAGAALDCDDDDPCTQDYCQAGTCINAPLAECDPCPAGQACDDGLICTVNDICTPAGGCVGEPVSCDDGIECTQDACVEGVGCVNNETACLTDCGADGEACDDDNACTTMNVCVSGVCTGTPVDCDDGDPCTIDSCDPLSGCTHTADPGCGPVECGPDGALCDDGDPCTFMEACSGGACLGTPVDCDDGNQCTDDLCNPDVGCLSLETPAAPCDDGNPCTINDLCQSGSCDGSALACDDGNACTLDSCNPASGECAHEVYEGCIPGSLTIPEDSGLVSFVSTDYDGVIGVTTDTPDLFVVQPYVEGGEIILQTAPDAFGSATLVMSPSGMETLFVTPVNDPPSFVDGGDITVFASPNPTTFVNWATEIVAGPPNESDQALYFQVTSDDPSLFSVEPTVSADGTLNFTTAPGAAGSSTTLTITLYDDGGTADQGIDESLHALVTVTIL